MDMADRRYLKRRGETWYYQRAVPADARKRWRWPSPIIETLGTRDLTQAQAERWKVHAKWQVRIDQATGRQSPKLPTHAEIEAAALEEFHTTLRVLDEIGVSDEAGLTQLIEANQRKLDLAEPSKHHPEVAKLHQDAARKLGIPVANIYVESAGSGRIVDRDYALIRARIAAIQARRKALAGIVPEEPQSFGRKSVDPVTLRPVLPRRGAKGGPKFADVAARFIAEKQRDPAAALTAQTVGQYEAAYRLFDSFAKQPCLGDVDRSLASEFLDKIANLDPVWGRSPATKKRSFAEIMEAYGKGARGLANKTVNRFAMALGMVWQFAEDRDGYGGGNPWSRQARPTGKRRGNGKTELRAFTPGELRKLLARKPLIVPKKHDTMSAMPWLVLIGTYGGMRLNEICSLDVDDVKQAGGIWYFDITEAKSEAGVRCVPVHSCILQAGLLDYRKRLKKGGQLFPGLRPGGPDDKLSWYASKRFTVLRRDLGIEDVDALTGRDRINFHSLRRSATTALKHARIPEHEAAEILGHDHPQVTFGVYPDKHKLRELQRIVETIRYEGLDVD